MKKAFLLLFFVMVLASPFPVRAATPLEIVKNNVERALEVLRDPRLAGADGLEVKKERIRAIANEAFDFEAISRFTLGHNWKKLNEAQRKEFVRLYRKLLERFYLEKIVSYTNERILFGEEKIIAGGRAVVESQIISSSGPVSVEYRMMKTDGTWKVYDVLVEGISLVANYRSQLRSILSRKSPDEMLSILREKVAEK